MRARRALQVHQSSVHLTMALRTPTRSGSQLSARQIASGASSPSMEANVSDSWRGSTGTLRRFAWLLLPGPRFAQAAQGCGR